jgi:SagB-type dehydrogenase family enzyme
VEQKKIMPIGRQFMLETQHKNMETSAQARGEPQPPIELPYDTTQRPVILPPPDTLELPPVNLRDVIEQRRTIRNYVVHAALSPAELSHLLWCTQGVQGLREPYATIRTVPSAGARHAFETHLLINDVAGIEPGPYRYLASQHQLIRLTLGDGLLQRTTLACLNQAQIVRSAVTFVWIAVRERMVWRYGERGYRYLHLDAGHVCQNLYLAAQVIGCGVCAIAAFDDAALNEAWELDGEDLFVIYLATVGKRRV